MFYFNFLSWYKMKYCDSILYIKMISNQSFQIIFYTFPLPFKLTRCLLTSPLLWLLSYSYSLLVSLNHHSCTNKWHVRAVDWIGNLITLHLSWSSSFYSLSSPLVWLPSQSQVLWTRTSDDLCSNPRHEKQVRSHKL